MREIQHQIRPLWRRTMKSTPIVYIAAALIACCAAGASPPIVIDLWPGKPPGDLPVRGEEKTYIRESALYGTNVLITNVTKPTLTVSFPTRGTNTGTAMVVCPGGGYWDLYWEGEGEQVASWLNSAGITAIILKYRVPRPPSVPESEVPIGPQMDAQRAVSTVRSRAAEWGINPKRIGIVGFSVGGHLALVTATNFAKRTYERIDATDDSSSRPDFAILCYSGFLKSKDKDEILPSISIPKDTPPVMLVHATDDTMSPSDHSVIMYLALKRAGVPVELHIFAKGEHDFGVRQDGRLPSSWTRLCLNWLRAFGLLDSHP
jgi:acetyl esterase/lipase